VSWVFVEHSNEWVVADLDAEPLAGARALVRSQAEEVDLRLEPERIEALAAVMVPALEISQSEDPPPVMVIFLYPRVDQPIVASIKIRAADLPADVTLDELLDDLRLPAEMLEQPAVEETIDTRSGPAVHLIQRYREPVDATFEQVQEHEVFAWIVDDDGPLLLTLSTSYANLAAASTWRPDLVALASTLVLKPDPEPESPYGRN
jgi:hypothetical protein